MTEELGTGPDTSGQHVTVEEAGVLFADAGVPRTPRSIRRYCQHGVLKAIRIESANTQEGYRIERQSVENFVAQLQQIYSGTSDRPGPDASGLDRSRPDMTGHHSASIDLIEILKEQVKKKDEQISIKDQQIGSLNKTVDNMIERDRETNVLLKILQENLFQLRAPADSRPDASAADAGGGQGAPAA